MPRELSESQQKALTALSHQVVDQLELRRHLHKQEGLASQLKNELGEKDLHIRLLMESTGEAIYGIDLNGDCTFCNPACLQMLGYQDRQELYGKNMHTLIHHTKPDGSPYPIQECHLCQSFQSGNETHVDEEIFWRENRTSFSVAYSSYPIRRKDQLIGSVVTFVDVTQRKQAEQSFQESERRYRSLFEQAPVCIHEIDLNGRLMTMNPVGLRMMGVQDCHEIEGTLYLDAVASQDKDRIEHLMRDAFQGESADFEFTIAGMDTPKTFSSNFIPVKDSNGQVMRVMGITQDITARKTTEAAMQISEHSIRTLYEITSSRNLSFEQKIRAFWS